ncbi:flagellar protein FlgN [Rheinheimera muenzenbergensis]|uniref:Flagellar protein FlgN n=1 Tax=Rheinheimera muenzenbergensis TaxID=1193628 RepID=A0ABU8C236_9GAMM
MTLIPDSIASLLQLQQQHLDVLLSLLRQELAALANRDIDSLEQLTVEKVKLLELIQQTDNQLANTAELAQSKEQDDFKQQVAVLDALLAQCKQQNDVNQLTMEQSQLRLAQFKHELLSSRGKSGLTYTSKGQPAVDSKGKGIKA